MIDNHKFENLLFETACEVLPEWADPEHYVSKVLDELWDGETYGEFYYEFSQYDTKHGRPVVVSL